MGCCNNFNNNQCGFKKPMQMEKITCKCYKEKEEHCDSSWQNKSCYEEEKKHNCACGCNQQQMYY